MAALAVAERWTERRDVVVARAAGLAAPDVLHAHEVGTGPGLEQLGVARAALEADAMHPVRKRGGRVYIDHLQNLRGKTIASVYSLRPFPRAPISVACTWDELPGLQPDSFTIATAPGRLQEVGDLFEGVLRLNQELPEELLT